MYFLIYIHVYVYVYPKSFKRTTSAAQTGSMPRPTGFWSRPMVDTKAPVPRSQCVPSKLPKMRGSKRSYLRKDLTINEFLNPAAPSTSRQNLGGSCLLSNVTNSRDGHLEMYSWLVEICASSGADNNLRLQETCPEATPMVIFPHFAHVCYCLLMLRLPVLCCHFAVKTARTLHMKTRRKHTRIGHAVLCNKSCYAKLEYFQTT